MSKSKRTKAVDIKQSTKRVVWERDNERCILCGSHQAMPNAHFISRAKQGLGIEQNIVTLCVVCHHNYDNTPQRESLGIMIESYLKAKYPNWKKSELVYSKW